MAASTEASRRLAGIMRAWEIQRERREEESQKRRPDFNEWFEGHASLLLVDFRPMFSEVWTPSWTSEEMKSGRLADHELLSRGCCLAAWLIIGLCLVLVAAFRFRAPPMIRPLSARIVP